MIIFGSPSRYVQGAGALSALGTELRRLGADAILVVDPLIQDLHGPAMRAFCEAAGVSARQLRFGGDCTHAEVERLLALAGRTEIVAAAGGGKCIDAGKAMAGRLGAEVVTIPTIASTDAPTSHNYVMYDETHRMVGVEKLKRNPALVLVDTQIIAQAPRHLFVAGIGDAIGKIYEVEACFNARGINVFGGQSALSALMLARACHRLLLDDSVNALAAIDRKAADNALERVVEATVLMSGLAFESGGLSISHSMTRGLTAVKPYADTLHGFQVAYANLVQVKLEGRPAAEIEALAAFYGRVGLPRSLAELGRQPAARADISRMAMLTMTAPHIRHFPRVLAASDVEDAMLWVEGVFSGLIQN
ncbi:glycerol dehydrogenase [Aestuariivirga sp.]|uniref:glycerol dehydrogenase n=1 Tax=Aestuariivirga sp. TaxID=2650926 RepID=UPI0039E3A2D5